MDLCSMCGGSSNSGMIGKEDLQSLIAGHDWRREMKNELADSLYSDRIDAGKLFDHIVGRSYQGLTKKSFQSIFMQQVSGRSVADASALWDWLLKGLKGSQSKDKISLSRDEFVQVMKEEEPPLDWERNTLALLASEMKSSEALMKSLDKNRDGKVSLEELHQALGSASVGLSSRQVALLLSAIDQDGSYDIDLKELRTALDEAEKESSRQTDSSGIRASAPASRYSGGKDTINPYPYAKSPEVGRWVRLRLEKIERLLVAAYPNPESAFRGLERASPAVHQGLGVQQWDAGLRKLFREARIPDPTSEQSKSTFYHMSAGTQYLSLKQFKTHFQWPWGQPALAWADTPHPEVGSAGIRAAAQQLRDKGAAICRVLGNVNSRVRRSQLVDAIRTVGIAMPPATLQQILEFAGQGHGSIDVMTLLHHCANA
eukprot:CAMPEP_0184318354 /NCGR_PEP_ID=MMETSP1049-20130417/102119_1 /TAXON_ID=77928 /ORGANISM="Proteomonas sulcata, Strain CCMP704" /LENGTH=428 /DNA_ID=CAMNT_0026638091 /DNA_START=30 /DNA_END=1316 /DNA_ORIENTATION=+